MGEDYVLFEIRAIQSTRWGTLEGDFIVHPIGTGNQAAQALNPCLQKTSGTITTFLGNSLRTG